MRRLALALVVAVMTSVCRSTPAHAPFRVSERTETFVDTARARTLVTHVFSPAVHGGPHFPLVVFGHGHGGRALDFRSLLHRLAAAGYVVAAPDFPDGANLLDILQEPNDVRFVIGRMLAGDRRDSIDRREIAVGGHSAGAIVALAVGYGRCCLDARVRAVFTFAGIGPGVIGSSFREGVGTPLLMVHGDADGTVPYSAGRRAFDELEPPKFFVTLLGQGHSAPYNDRPPAHPGDAVHRVVGTSVVDFLDRYLGGDDDALGRLRRDANRAGVARLEFKVR